MKARTCIWVCLAALAALWGCEPAATRPDTNSQTHWLSSCEQDSDCQGGFSCFCGVCTTSCDAPDACAGLDEQAVCAPPAGAQVDEACASGLAPSLQVGICLPPPEDNTPTEQICGTAQAPTCPEGQYCHRAQDACDDAGTPGLCRAQPEGCTEEFDPVCGCDGTTYSNACFAAGAGVNVASQGACEEQPPEDVPCGARAGDTCAADEYCAYEEGQLCGAADQEAVCRPRPEACDQEFAPVCGCDGVTYSNACTANSAGVGVLRSGECEEGPPVEVPCGARAGDTCAADEYCAYEEGQLCGAADQEAVCRPRPSACDQVEEPVCACDGQTYSNACVANAAGVGVLRSGACDGEPGGCLGDGDCGEGEYCDFPEGDACGLFLETPGACQEIPEICTEEFAPVCGCDGVTYDNDCFAAGAGVNVASQGECVQPVVCGGFAGVACGEDEYCDFPEEAMCGFADATGLCRARPDDCTQEVDLVCGCDGLNYTNACSAHALGVGVLHSGECQQ